MSEFITQSHERRLEAIDAVKVEVQRGYEEQIAELRAQVMMAHEHADVGSLYYVLTITRSLCLHSSII